MNRVEFVSYDGSFPNLCRGTLILKLDGKEITFPKYCLNSNGWFDDEYCAYQGDWEICKWPMGFPKDCMKEATAVVNENIEHGCCGGCA